jgi:hypothetical protein
VVLSGAFLLVLALLGLVVAATGGGSGAGGRSHSTPLSAVLPAGPPSGISTGGCAASQGGSQAVPSSGPPRARWAAVGSMQVPQNPAVYGPARSEGPWETCFARDPSGALLAAMNFWAEGTAVAPSELLQRLAVGAPKNLGNNARLDAGGPIQFAGYRYDSYTPSEAQVAVVFRGPGGKLLAVVTTMVWRGGDWKYLFPPAGTPPMQAITDLAGYEPWSSFS